GTPLWRVLRHRLEWTHGRGEGHRRAQGGGAPRRGRGVRPYRRARGERDHRRAVRPRRLPGHHPQRDGGARGARLPHAPAHVLRVELVEMGTKLLVLVIAQHGQVRTRMIERPDGVDADAIEDVARRVTEAAADTTLRAAHGRTSQLARDASPVEAGLFAMVAESIGDIETHAAEEHVLVGGVGNLTGELAVWRVETMRR